MVALCLHILCVIYLNTSTGAIGLSKKTLKYVPLHSVENPIVKPQFFKLLEQKFSCTKIKVCDAGI